MILSFAGTRRGMTDAQRATVARLFEDLELHVLHHGGEKHADAEAQREGLRLGAFIAVHPGPAFDVKDCPGADVFYSVRENLDRNGDVAFVGTNGLIAAPAQACEVLRSGTWSTVRRARKFGRHIWIVLPDGSVKEEQ